MIPRTSLQQLMRKCLTVLKKRGMYKKKKKKVKNNPAGANFLIATSKVHMQRFRKKYAVILKKW